MKDIGGGGEIQSGVKHAEGMAGIFLESDLFLCMLGIDVALKGKFNRDRTARCYRPQGGVHLNELHCPACLPHCIGLGVVPSSIGNMKDPPGYSFQLGPE